MAESIKYTLEEFGITVASGLGLPDLEHVDSANKADQERLIFSANIGDKKLEAAKMYGCELEVELRSTDRDSDAVDAIFETLESAMLTALQNIAAGADCAALDFVEANYSDFIGYPENWSSSDARGPNSRHRIRKYPFDLLPLS